MSIREVKSQIAKNKIGWRKSFMEGFSQDDNGNPIPWMTYSFIDFISDKLNKNHTIFEYGCGASTLFFAPKVKKIVTLESNAMWKRLMEARLTKAGITNVEIILMEDGFINPDYEHFAKTYSRKFDQEFDYIFVDSLKRAECAKHSYVALKDDGTLVVDDAERKSYKKIFKFFEKKNFIRQDFLGIAPGQFYVKNTTTFKRP